uniref:Putative wd repeat protein n=1 Tax=Panstrongylus megistus TaxID=65343 RepID=A0A069DTG7_9HEMI
MEDDTPLIYGLEFQARSLTVQQADTDVTRFMVGTQTLKIASNQVHVVEVCDDTGVLSAQTFSHPWGELWHLHWSPHDSRLFSACYNTITEEQGTNMKCALYTLHKVEENEEENKLEPVTVLDIEAEVKVSYFHPSDPTKFLVISDSKFGVWDIGDVTPVETYKKPLQSKGGSKMSNGKWNPLESGAAVATIQESSVKGWDLRTSKEVWSIEQPEAPIIRDIDYNRNRQHILCTCGDDGRVKIWDTRAVDRGPVLALPGNHTHWAWAVRYNLLHDELLLSCGSDSCCRLWWAGGAASESTPPATAHETTPTSSPPQEITTRQQNYADGPLHDFTTSDDSVYTVEWSAVDPWTFAFLSYDGRLIVHRVPKYIKYHILDI